MFTFNKTRNTYLFPIKNARSLTEESISLSKDFPVNKLTDIDGIKAWKYSPAHKGIFKNALDILVPDGTEILAAADGKVIEFIENNHEYGGEEFRDKANFISILHKNDEVSQYVHLEKNSVTNSGIKVGDEVKAGQEIAVVGKTGWTTQDHLHFVVFKLKGGSIKRSLRPDFILKKF